MIALEEIPISDIEKFWRAHYEYLIRDGILTDDEEKEYFRGDEYRLVILDHMKRSVDRHHLAYFTQDGTRIGAVSYCIFQSEDGKCFILDYWVFPPFRGGGTGHRCFEALRRHAAADGALYYVINCDGREDRMRFWKSLGFAEKGVDEYGMPLLLRQER